MIIKDGILFHNVEELEETPEGFRMWRLPKDVRNCLNPGIYEPDNCLSTGIELRFQMLGDGVDLLRIFIMVRFRADGAIPLG